MTENQTFNEAPASWNVKYLIRGFDCQLTLRANNGAELIPQIERALKWLEDHSAEPVRPVSREQTPNNQPPAPPKMADGTPDPAWCSIHNVAMGRRERDGQVWYSHKIGEGYCKGK